MKVLKYEGVTLQEAMKKVKSDLGDDVIIISSKKRKKRSWIPFLNTEVIEVEVMKMAPPPSRIEKERYEKNNSSREPYTLERKVRNEIKGNNDVMKELSELKKAFQHLQNQEQDVYPAVIRDVNRTWKELGFHQSVVEEMNRFLLREWSLYHGTPTLKIIQNWLKQWVFEVWEQKKWQEFQFQNRYVCLFGATGVGKTTTIAKLAGELILAQQKKVAFITLDTYRIGAVEQLKIYAEILNIPCRVCYSKEDFLKAKEDFKHYDVIFIDTPGRNYRQKKYIEELESYFTTNENIDKLLIISASSRFNDVQRMVQDARHIQISSIVFTKCDETTNYSTLFNTWLLYEYPPSYITDGQDVPEDIKVITKEQLSRLLLGDEDHA